MIKPPVENLPAVVMEQHLPGLGIEHDRLYLLATPSAAHGEGAIFFRLADGGDDGPLDGKDCFRPGPVTAAFGREDGRLGNAGKIGKLTPGQAGLRPKLEQGARPRP